MAQESTRKQPFHESSYELGSFQDGAWHCAHGDLAFAQLAGRGSTHPGMRFWTCDKGKHRNAACRFFLWEDHLEDARRYHNIPTDVSFHAPVTPRKRQKDGDIRQFCQSAKVARTAASPSFETPTPKMQFSEPTRRSNRAAAIPSRREPSPSPLARVATSRSSPRRRPVAVPQEDQQSPSSPPRPSRNAQPRAQAKIQGPTTPVRDAARVASPPQSARRKLSSWELRAYEAAIKALCASGVHLTLKGQNGLREIIRDESLPGRTR